MFEPAANPDLMPSLGRLVRGLSALFWGLPLALLTCAQSDIFHWFAPYGFLVPPAATALLWHGANQLGYFQRQERVWMRAVDVLRAFGGLTFGLSPFLYFWNRFPADPFFAQNVGLMAITALLFMISLNHALYRLAAMLPDEMLRHENRMFTAFNAGLLAVLLLVLLSFLAAQQLGRGWVVSYLSRLLPMALVSLVLLPLALTMTLLWKTKETILHSVFGPQQAVSAGLPSKN